ncbi:MAG: SUMF1/EgtB/PvdO family nonheme iron enzyme, partial [Nitrospina sp.]|nr:SUMF1/EgtB/PvdO family nonheme iron enzyme [Nitrospina sp.]
MSPCITKLKSILTLLFLATFSFVFPAQAQDSPPANMILIPQGYFQMGTSSGNDDEKPMHFVYTSGFYIDKYEVSNKDYQAFMEATHPPAPIYWND